MNPFLLLAIFLPLNAGAATLPPGFDKAKYESLTRVAAETGDRLEGPDGLTFKVLSHIAPADTAKPHRAEYFSAVGADDASGHFGVAEISMVSEDWRKRENGDWEIEQWLWTAWTDGTLVRVNHFLLVENAGGSVLDDVALPAGGPGDDAELARWERKLEEWYSYP